MFTAARLRATLRRLGLEPRFEVFDELSAAYAEEGRHYHTARHIAECLRHFDAHGDLALRAPEVEIALWFHDAVYDTRRTDNEERSAAWAASYLASEGLDTEAMHRIEALILATRHEARPRVTDQQLLVDIDLGILGQPGEVFSAYDAAIRLEYHWVSQSDYRRGRLAVLSGFLARDRIYCTDRFFELFEVAARRNIAHAIEALGMDASEQT